MKKTILAVLLLGCSSTNTNDGLYQGADAGPDAAGQAGGGAAGAGGASGGSAGVAGAPGSGGAAGVGGGGAGGQAGAPSGGAGGQAGSPAGGGTGGTPPDPCASCICGATNSVSDCKNWSWICYCAPECNLPNAQLAGSSYGCSSFPNGCKYWCTNNKPE